MTNGNSFTLGGTGRINRGAICLKNWGSVSFKALNFSHREVAACFARLGTWEIEVNDILKSLYKTAWEIHACENHLGDSLSEKKLDPERESETLN